MSLIDHVITNAPQNIILSGVYPSSISDHRIIYAARKIGASGGNPKFIESRSFKHFGTTVFQSDHCYANWPATEFVNNANDYWAQVKKKKVFLNVIDRMHKWRPIKYSFVYVLITLTSLVCMDKIQKKCCLRARLVSLIST